MEKMADDGDLPDRRYDSDSMAKMLSHKIFD